MHGTTPIWGGSGLEASVSPKTGLPLAMLVFCHALGLVFPTGFVAGSGDLCTRTGARLLGPCVALTALKPQLAISDDQRAVSPVARAPELNWERALSPPADLVFGGVFDRARFRLWAAALGEF